MTTATEFDAKTNVETWETTTDGTVWVWIRDPREVQGYRKQRVGGKAGGSRVLRITTDDRRFNQEQVVDENKVDHDPFVNGLLRKTDEQHVDDIDATYHLTNSTLLELLEIRDPELFEPEVTDIKSELVLRRLYSLAEKDGTAPQVEFIRELLEERYGRGGTQQSVREQDKPGYRGLSLSN